MPWLQLLLECEEEIPYGARAFKCTDCSNSLCSFYLHPHCVRKPKETEYPFHPNHPLTTLLQMPPIDESEKLQCIACCRRIDNVFLLHCTESECSNINLDIGCVFRKPAVKYQRHDHPLVYFEKIYLHGARCSVCNLLCDENLFRCYACNFNIHPECLLKPLKIIFDDHVHPLTLTSLLIEKEEQNGYYCDNCDEITDPLADVYWCKHENCWFGAHIDCIPQERITEVVEASSPQILEENLAASLTKLMLRD
ncbi:protein VACUOLELESS GAMETOPHYTES isoform X2 [Ziziphus jujuba]|uniref:Protein VACUOLELESS GAMETOPHYTES isoform X2 n=1 Tax=Ziziphus jujuba TaxID=326968 RepID=A0A6P6GC50_ZIZJJ|nr:protein VACUOLELESS GAMETOPHYTES isoform X2 [Ziziphus jujuba]